MSEELPKKIGTKKDELINKCLFGSLYEPERIKACIKLSQDCNSELMKLTEEKRKKVQQSIVDDVRYINHADDFDTVKISEKEYPKYYTESVLFDPPKDKEHPSGFDYDKYIEDKKHEKYGTCNLALYGLESQFIDQISTGYFQTNQNADAMKKAEEKILYTDKDTIETCNRIHNPKINEFEYKVCAEAALHDSQKPHLVIKRKDEVSHAIITDDYEKIRKLPIRLVWEAMGDAGKRIMDEIGIPYKENIMDYSKGTRDKIREIKDKLYTHDDIVRITKDLPAKYKWREAGRLNCINNIYGLVNYPEQIKNKWLEIQLSLDAGEIDEKQALKLIEDLAKMEEMFKIQLAENAPSKFEKPTTHQPSRLRIHGAQGLFNKIFHEILLDEDNKFDIIEQKDSYIANTIRNTFSKLEMRQLINNEIYEGDIRKIIDLDISYQDIYDVILPVVEEVTRSRMSDDPFEYFPYDVFDSIKPEIKDFYNIIDIDIKDQANEFIYYVEDYDEYTLTDNEIIVAEGVNRGWEEEYTVEDIIQYHLKDIQKDYPEVTADILRFIFKLEGATRMVFSFDVGYTAVYSKNAMRNELQQFIETMIHDATARYELRKQAVRYIIDAIQTYNSIENIGERFERIKNIEDIMVDYNSESIDEGELINKLSERLK